MIVHIHGSMPNRSHGHSDQDPRGRFNAQDKRGGRGLSQSRDEDLEYRIEDGEKAVRNQKKDRKETPEERRKAKGYTETGLDVVQEASKESFPASDPPPWTLGR